ncbi:MAG: NapC/NirT family cytochrome c [Rhodospirillales bacterium]|nr:NapC/NirT family cytochrome c [Rhodospirillales bacterium]
MNRATRKGVLLAGVFLIGVVAAGAFAATVQYTNRLAFCIGCHEMESTVYQEYRQTIHFSNRSGVQATCADCHVPHHNVFATLWRKVKATNEVFHHLVGSIDTPEKFEARRLALAQNVWAEMKANDSRECRNCHDFTAMNLAMQKNRSAKMHQSAKEAGETCIDCHKGIAHKAVHKQIETAEPADFDIQ